MTSEPCPDARHLPTQLAPSWCQGGIDHTVYLKKQSHEMVSQKKRHSLFVGGFLILCNPVSVKLESPDSGNGHKKMY